MLNYLFSIAIFFIISNINLFGTSVKYTNEKEIIRFRNILPFIQDNTNNKKLSDIISLFRYCKESKPTGETIYAPSTYWYKLDIENITNSPLLLQIPNTLMTNVTLYSVVEGKMTIVKIPSPGINFQGRAFNHPHFIFDLNLKFKEIRSYYLKINSINSIQPIIEIGTIKNILEKNNEKDVFYAAYFGILSVMILYNLFLFLTIKHKRYLYYCFHIFTILITQNFIEGYLFKYLNLTVNSPFVPLIILLPIQAFFGIKFFRASIKVNETCPRLNKVVNYFLATSFCTYFVIFFGQIEIARICINVIGFIISINLLIMLIYVAKKNVTGKIFLAAYVIYLSGTILYSLKNLDLLPFNEFTNYVMPIGAIIEVFVLSIALGNQINVLQNEFNKSKEETINQLIKNEIQLKKSQELVLKSERMEKEKLISEFNFLKSQIDPHFLFNNFNILNELISVNPQLAENFVIKLSEVYRYVLTNSKKELITVREEISFIYAFIYLLNIRFDNNIQFFADIDSISHKYIPPMALQLLVENAMKHNIISKAYPLSISITNTDDYIVCSNNINLKMNSNNSLGIGLQNLRLRFSFLAEKQLLISKENNKFIVKIPVIENHKVI